MGRGSSSPRLEVRDERSPVMRKRTVFIVVLAVLLLSGLFMPRAALASNYVYHRVKYGETLTSIAHKYGVSIYSIAQANGIYNLNLIYAGQVLLIPVSAAAPSPSGCVEVHVVRRGENLTTIAARYGVSVSAIVRANSIRNPNLIYINQRLRIPCTAPSAATPAPTPTYPNWKGQYWDNQLLSGNPTFIRNDTKLDFSWGLGGPGQGVGPDTFSVRWTATPTLAAGGTYRFHVQADDGVRLWLDGTLVVDEWHLAGNKTYTVDREVTAGKHGLQVDYYEQTGNAFIKVWWERLGAAIPSDAWVAEYYGNRSFEGPALVSRQEPAIAYDWGTGPPLPGFRLDDFTVRWQRDWSLSEANYRLTVRVDDGVRVWVDGRLVIDEWRDSGGATYSEDFYLPEGSHRFKVEYYEATGTAMIHVDLVPLSQIFNWRGEYFNNIHLQGSPAAERQEGAIDFNWGNKSPIAGVTADYFSVRWTGEFPFAGGTYQFYARADDGIRVFVDGVAIIDEWHLATDRTYWAGITLNAGTHVVKVEYFELTGDALAKLWLWSD
jgi:LysM repeat protein